MSIRKTLVAAAFAAVAVLGTAGTASASGASAVGAADNSPGFLSGNVVQIPINLPINLCGNTIDIISLLNPAYDNVCINH